MKLWITGQDFERDFGVRVHNLRNRQKENPEQIRTVRCRGRVLYSLPDLIRFFGE